MAQIQKESVRAAIIAAAKTQFIKNGIEASSMRVIASEAGITVGNIYRYFENKEDLADEIIVPTLNRLNQALFFELDDINEIKSQEAALVYFDEKVKQLSHGFLSVFKEFKDESLIVLNYPRFYDEVVLTLYQLIQYLIKSLNILDTSIKYSDELSMMLSQSIMSGLAKGLSDTLVDYHDDFEALSEIVNLYLHLYTMMLKVGMHDE